MTYKMADNTEVRINRNTDGTYTATRHWHGDAHGMNVFTGSLDEAKQYTEKLAAEIANWNFWLGR